MAGGVEAVVERGETVERRLLPVMAGSWPAG